jgi:ABC-type Fe3+-hydroxamate transport system substrate-binding protein
MKADQELIDYMQERVQALSQKSRDRKRTTFARFYYSGKADTFKEVLDIVLDAEAHYENN